MACFQTKEFFTLISVECFGKFVTGQSRQEETVFSKVMCWGKNIKVKGFCVHQEDERV